LVHNILLSMPFPTAPDKVLTAARKFARERFGAQHRYAMVLHTDQKHPHVHLVVKAESEHGRRLHIDKEMLREWRDDFARLMREQGIAANATRRIVRREKGTNADSILRARRRGNSTATRERVALVAAELSRTGTFRDPARTKLVETRKSVAARWANIADTLEAQGEIGLASEVRDFIHGLPKILTDRERLAMDLVRHIQDSRPAEQT
jgi:hypothetical protein